MIIDRKMEEYFRGDARRRTYCAGVAGNVRATDRFIGA
ncbi:MAG: hypothetical protein BMS9Abin14_084 [Gammaproteobacteria bacterium]|nr:MAG: hypothetical protein BMS9Abin14_084 [Gammaproteobacteria bacterium]